MPSIFTPSCAVFGVPTEELIFCFEEGNFFGSGFGAVFFETTAFLATGDAAFLGAFLERFFFIPEDTRETPLPVKEKRGLHRHIIL